MNLTHKRVSSKAKAAFTLVEMIGVLAIISILASLLIPRVFQAIGDSKISNAASSCNGIKAAVNEYYGKYGLIAGTGGASLSLTNSGDISEDWDLNVLVAEGIAEKPFSVRIGNGVLGSAASGSRLRVINISGNNTSVDPLASLANGAYNLDGSTNATTVNDVTGNLLVEAVIQAVDAQDAKDFNDRIDGSVLGATNLVSVDNRGRVKYSAPVGGKTDVRVYMAHR
jgi:prepilin-type N-terminal cleavage/methylation domain-containing protein